MILVVLIGNSDDNYTDNKDGDDNSDYGDNMC